MKYLVECNPKYQGIHQVIKEMLDGKRLTGWDTIYEGRNLLYRAEINGINVVVKEFGKPNAINAYVYTTLRESKARRSFENGMKMLQLGFSTPEPVGYGELRDGLRLVRSVYVSLELTGAREMRFWEKFPDISTLLPAFAAEIWRLHQAGVYHRDFSPGNVLYTGDKDSGYTFHYVDLNRMRFDEHRSSQLMRMLRSINPLREETARIGRLYGEASGQDPDKTEQEALRQLDGYLAERRRKQRWKNLFKH